MLGYLHKPSRVYQSALVTVESVRNRGAVITYKVVVGTYAVSVRLLNVNDEVSTRPYEKVINSGAFGKIILGVSPDG